MHLHSECLFALEFSHGLRSESMEAEVEFAAHPFWTPGFLWQVDINICVTFGSDRCLPGIYEHEFPPSSIPPSRCHPADKHPLGLPGGAFANKSLVFPFIWKLRPPIYYCSTPSCPRLPCWYPVAGAPRKWTREDQNAKRKRIRSQWVKMMQIHEVEALVYELVGETQEIDLEEWWQRR